MKDVSQKYIIVAFKWTVLLCGLQFNQSDNLLIKKKEKE